MRKAALLGLAVLLGAIGLTAEAQVARQQKPAPDLKAGVARIAQLKDTTVERALKAMPDAMVEQLEAGRSVTIEGVGTFQVVRVEAYDDLVQGRPTRIPARNFIEFVPAEKLSLSANAEGVVPARSVQGYEFRVNPNAAPGIKTETRRTPPTRVR